MTKRLLESLRVMGAKRWRFCGKLLEKEEEQLGKGHSYIVMSPSCGCGVRVPRSSYNRFQYPYAMRWQGGHDSTDQYRRRAKK